MIGKLREMLAGLTPNTPAVDDDAAPDLAVAVLLVEMARADHQLGDAETAEMSRQLQASFGLDDAAATALLEQAHARANDSVSLHEFTRALHEGLDYAEKQRVVQMLWQVAFADQNIDKYEDYLVGKVAELLYVSRGDVIRLRQQVAESRNPPYGR